MCTISKLLFLNLANFLFELFFYLSATVSARDELFFLVSNRSEVTSASKCSFSFCQLLMFWKVRQQTYKELITHGFGRFAPCGHWHRLHKGLCIGFIFFHFACFLFYVACKLILLLPLKEAYHKPNQGLSLSLK